MKVTIDTAVAVEKVFATRIKRVGVRSTKGEPNRRRSSDARSPTYDDIDSTEVRGFAGDWIHQRKECDPYFEGNSERKRNFVGQRFWARGYFVSTVGRDEELIWEYIRHQEDEDRRVDQLKLM